MRSDTSVMSRRSGTKAIRTLLAWSWRRGLRLLRRKLYLRFQLWMELTPYEIRPKPFEIRRRLPRFTLKPLDLILASYDTRGGAVTILQVGACDGISNDPIHRHVAKGLTRAILVEPNPYSFTRLQATYEGLPN